METAERVAYIESELPSFKQQHEETEIQIANQKEKLAAVMDKMNLLLDVAPTSPFDVNVNHCHYSISEDDVELEFMAEKQRRSGKGHQVTVSDTSHR